MPGDPRLLDFARSMRCEPTPAEKVMWRLLRNRQLAGFKFRRQHPLGLYILDFYSRDAALVVELDGDSYFTPEGIEHDRVRHAYLASLGLFVLRFPNTDVYDNEEDVIELIGATCHQRTGFLRRRTPTRHRQPRQREPLAPSLPLCGGEGRGEGVFPRSTHP
ncbi:MAG TPA: endonuclease domain-containing protein [Gemmataceae bacterium]|nr:endonuclease domain-containing protein [Gemmataceae bacterium]